MLHKLDKLIVATTVVASLFVTQAVAEEATGPAEAEKTVAAVESPFGRKVVDPSVLARQRGGDAVLNDMKLNGVVSDNRASNLVTGNNVITDGAFAGVNGVPLVVQNSGNNVLIQSATIVNVQVK